MVSSRVVREVIDDFLGIYYYVIVLFIFWECKFWEESFLLFNSFCLFLSFLPVARKLAVHCTWIGYSMVRYDRLDTGAEFVTYKLLAVVSLRKKGMQPHSDMGATTEYNCSWSLDAAKASPDKFQVDKRIADRKCAGTSGMKAWCFQPHDQGYSLHFSMITKQLPCERRDS